VLDPRVLDPRVLDPRGLIDAAPMSRAQVAAVAGTVALSALDGFDVLAVTFVAPGVAREFGIDRAGLGLVLAAGLAGMALGSLLLAPLADRFGRRRLVLVSLALMALGMFASAAAGGVVALAAWRVVTGLGIGAMVAVITPLAAEYASRDRRALAVALMAIGYPLGGVVGGTIAAVLIRTHGWRAVFLLGGVAAVILIPVVGVALPESIAYLVERRPRGALARTNAVLARFGHPVIAALPAPVGPEHGDRATLFRGALLRVTVTVTLVNFLYVIAVYYFLSWLPQLVVDAGFAAPVAAGVSVVANLAGVAGGLAVGWLTPRLGLKPVAVCVLVGMGVATAAFGSVPADLALLRAAAGVTGFFLFGGIAAVYAVIARSFPASVRATGAGFVIGIGRGGSALAPALAGFLFAAGLGRGGVSLLIGGCAVVAGAVLLRSRLIATSG